jgi:Protein of unknown function (DUF2752)
LQRERLVAIVSAQLTPKTVDESNEELPVVIPHLAWWVRCILLVGALGLVIVFTLAVLLNPYDEFGQPRRMETHRTPPLNLPPCDFKSRTGLPCPSCGMTSSFSLLMHGDPLNSMRANWVGTLLASYCLFLVPWSFASVIVKRPLFVTSLERMVAISIFTFLAILLLRWGTVLLLIWINKQPG